MWDVQMVGAACFGAIIGWYVYYINRWRKAEVTFGDLVTVIGIVGGAAVLELFGNPSAEGQRAATNLFGAYGIGLFLGFFGYFLALVVMVKFSRNFDVEWFLDGRSRDAEGKALPGVGGGRAMQIEIKKDL